MSDQFKRIQQRIKLSGKKSLKKKNSYAISHLQTQMVKRRKNKCISKFKLAICISTPVLILIGSLLACGSAQGLQTSMYTGAAFNSLPPYTHSWYLTENPNDGPSYPGMQHLAQMDATWANTTVRCTNGFQGITVFATGQREYAGGGFGISDHGGHLWTDTQIINAMSVYIKSWVALAPSCAKLTVAVGLNNATCLSRHDMSNTCNAIDFNAAGMAWAELINTLSLWLVQQHITNVKVCGADDIETTWDAPVPTRKFVTGFMSHNLSGLPLVNFGDIRPDSRWSLPDVRAVTMSGYAGPGSQVVVLPEVYWNAPDDVAFWTDFKTQNPGVTYIGLMTECTRPQQGLLTDNSLLQLIASKGYCDGGSDLNPDLAWQAIKPVVQNDPFIYATNIQYQPA